MKYRGVGTYDIDGWKMWIEFFADAICLDGYCSPDSLSEIVKAYWEWRRKR